LKKLLPILTFCLFCLNCEQGWIKDIIVPPVEGCTDSSSCNYNSDAEEDDGSCLTNDCAGECGGLAVVDSCLVCDTDSSNDCIKDCAGNWGGTSVLSGCDNLCNSTAVEDCAGVCGGNAVDSDGDGICDSDEPVYGCTTPSACNFDANATIFDDSCWSATDGCACSDGEGAVVDCAGVCGGTSVLSGCDNLCNSTAVEDECGVCGGEIGKHIELWGMCYDIATTNYINLYNEGLTGPIPPEFGNLTNLTSLSLGNNQLSGEIPPEIGNLTNLTYLGLWHNQLSGEIPSEIGNLTNLTELYFSYNQLSGEIPEQVCALIESNNLGMVDILTGNTLINCIQDCAGTWGGDAVLSGCDNVCNSTAEEDCTGVCNGTSTYDCANVCCEGTTGISCHSTDDCGTITDNEGNTYKTIKIGAQNWMAENLKVTKYKDGSAITTGYSNSEWENLSTGAYAVYDDNPSNADIYGNLYNWYTVDDSRGVCPDGWHVSTDEDWTILLLYIGVSEVINGNMGTNEGGKLKEVGTEHWEETNEDVTNETGFTVLPAGNRNIDGQYGGIYTNAKIWTSSGLSEYSNAWTIYLQKDNTIYRGTFQYERGHSVRCLKD